MVNETFSFKVFNQAGFSILRARASVVFTFFQPHRIFRKAVSTNILENLLVVIVNFPKGDLFLALEVTKSPSLIRALVFLARDVDNTTRSCLLFLPPRVKARTI